MDAYEATKVVFSRIQALDPENAAKIMGLLLLKDHGEKEMIRLAFGPETLIHSVILGARKDLGLSSSSPSSPSTGTAISPFLNRQNSSSGRVMPPSPLAVSSPSWAPPQVFSRSNGAVEDVHGSEELISPCNGEPSPFFNAGSDYLDELQLQEQLAFLNEQSNGAKTGGNAGSSDLFYPDMECRSPDGLGFPYGWPLTGQHRRSCSANATADLAGLGGDAAAGFGWKPCMYFAKGYCRNGSTCRFVHGLLDESAAAALVGSKMDAAVEQQCQELLLRSKSQRISSASQLMASAFPYSPTGSPSASSKCLSFLLQQQQQNESRRAVAAAAAALMMGGDESHKFMARARFDRNDLNPVSRQIYLTFPADSTFREEDVSNYFSIYGPVQDVRIPYQQKRMFGFVTFVYPETVKLILAKGNPHFVCDARVLVKPYKEKGKVPEKFRKQQQADFSMCTSPTGFGLDSRGGDPFDLQQLGSRMLYNNGSSQELLLRRKLEEQQHAAELQKAIELQSRRFMGLQLMDLKNRNILSSSAPAFINTTGFTTTPTSLTDEISNGSSSINSNEVSSPEEKSPTGDAGEDVQVKSSYHGFFHQNAVNIDDKNLEAITTNDSEIQESGEHNLPDSPFASPTKSSNATPFSAAEVDIATSSATTTTTAACNNVSNSGSNTTNNHLISPTLLPPSPTLEMGPFKSCFFQMPRLSSSHGAIGM